MWFNLALILLFAMSPSNTLTKSTSQRHFVWDTEIKLPIIDNSIGKENKGLAGVFSGIIEDNLILLGGANFPDKLPWEGGMKKWWTTFYSYNLIDKTWEVIPDFLSHPMAYGVSIQLHDEIVCIGGCNEAACFSEVWSIIKGENGWKINDNWPTLPVALACGTGVLCDSKIFIFGGQTSMQNQVATSYAFMLDLNDKGSGWKVLPSWPGEPRGYAVSAALNGKVYLFSGRNYDNAEILNVHRDGFVYTLDTQNWELLNGEFPFMAGTAFAFGNEEILFAGGVTKIEPTSPNHPGFSNSIFHYNVRNEDLSLLEKCPYPIPVTTNLVMQDETIYITSGEIRPGIRSPNVLRGILKE